MFKISEEVKLDILKTLIEPSYKNDVKEIIKMRKSFRLLGITFETLSKILVGVSSVISFAAGIYKIPILYFLSGSSSVLSLVLIQFSSYAYKESTQYTVELNSILNKLNITPVIDIEQSVDLLG